MIDALLLAVRDAIRDPRFSLDYATCEIMAEGKPPPRCGGVFVAIHELASRSTADNCLDERFAFGVTLTMRVTIPVDRAGDQLLVRTMANDSGFTKRAEELRAYLHMNWDVLGTANNFLLSFGGEGQVYGFCEPARYRGREEVQLVGGDWFGADFDSPEDGLKSTLRFEDCRRFQAIASFV